MNPAMFSFGPWSPDLANNGMLALFSSLMGPVPCADVLNVSYQDGSYRCLPGPQAIAPTLGAQALNAFSWYDNTGAQEMVFAATASGISALAAGVWSAVPLIGQVFIAATPWIARAVWASIIQPQPWILTSTMGTTTVQGQSFSGTLNAGTGTGGIFGYSSITGSSCGSLTPTIDTASHTIVALLFVPSGSLQLSYGTAGLGASYFTQLSFPGLGKTYLASAATYTSSGGQSTYAWSVASSPFGAGATAVQIT